MRETFIRALENRRSIYSIGNKSALPEETILEIVRRAVTAAPSAFNSQSSRVIVLFGKSHETLWNDTKEILRAAVTAGNFSKTEKKIDSFRSGFGTVLYFEDQDTVAGLQKQFPTYRDSFPVWSLESAGMLQLAVWTALEEAGLGASLQHYNPLIDETVRTRWEAPENWKLLAQMPFGCATGRPGPKEFMPVEKRVKVFR